jgi:hypothetical protein
VTLEAVEENTAEMDLKFLSIVYETNLTTVSTNFQFTGSMPDGGEAQWS